jgi:hypothetical protein
MFMRALIVTTSLVAGCGAVADPGSEQKQNLRAAPDLIELPDGGVTFAGGPLTLLVVFDTSGSMGTAWDHRTRWQAANEALLSAIDEFEENLTVGAIRFPTDQDCGVASLEPGSTLDFQSGASFLSTWREQPNSPAGNTPLESALVQADAAIVSAAERGLLEHRFRVLVFSDGEPTCADEPETMIDFPRRWQEMGIHTYVLGLPGSAPAFDLLGAMANAGGTGAAVGGGPAIKNDATSTAIYERGVEQNHTDNIVVESEADLDDVTRALAR